MILQPRPQSFHRFLWMFANSALTYLWNHSAVLYLINALFRLSFSNFILVMLSSAACFIPRNNTILFSISSSVIVYTLSLPFQNDTSLLSCILCNRFISWWQISFLRSISFLTCLYKKAASLRTLTIISSTTITLFICWHQMLKSRFRYS